MLNNAKQVMPGMATTAHHMLRLALPVIASRLLNASINLTCMLMIAHLGRDALAASALINSVILTLTMMIWSMPMGTGVVVGHAYGAGKIDAIGAIVRQCLWLGVFIGVPSTIILWNIAPVLVLLGQDPHLVNIAAQYFRAYAWGIVPSIWIICFSQFAVGILRPRLIIAWSFLTLPLAIIPSYILLFGKYGFPALGVAGAGYTISVTFWIMFIIELLWLGYGKQYRKYCLLTWQNWRDLFKFNYLRELLSFGWFTTVQISAEFFALSFATIFMGWFGENALASQQIIIQINAFVSMIPFGISQVSSILISQALGAKRLLDVRHLGYTAILLGAAAGLVFIGFYCFFPKVIIGFYLDTALAENSEIVHMAEVLLIIASFTLMFNCLRVAASGSLRGLFDTKVPMLTSVFLSGLGSLAIGYGLAFWLNPGLGVFGIGLGFVFGMCGSALTLMWRLHKLSDPLRL